MLRIFQIVQHLSADRVLDDSTASFCRVVHKGGVVCARIGFCWTMISVHVVLIASGTSATLKKNAIYITSSLWGSFLKSAGLSIEVHCSTCVLEGTSRRATSFRKLFCSGQAIAAQCNWEDSQTNRVRCYSDPWRLQVDGPKCKHPLKSIHVLDTIMVEADKFSAAVFLHTSSFRWTVHLEVGVRDQAVGRALQSSVRSDIDLVDSSLENINMLIARHRLTRKQRFEFRVVLVRVRQWQKKLSALQDCAHWSTCPDADRLMMMHR